MWIKYILITLSFFIISIMQNSFLTYFGIMGELPNLIFILFFILIFFEGSDTYFDGFFMAIIAGLFSDMFLPAYFGATIISLIVVYFLKKFLMYFITENQSKYPVFYFISLFSVCFIVNRLILYIISFFLQLHFTFNSSIISSLIYNLVFACIGFYLYKKICKKSDLSNQLRLL